MRIRSFFLTSFLGLSVAVAPLPALANQPANQEEAKQLYADGETAYRLGNFEEAVQKFEAAYAKSRLPVILFNIGLAYDRLYGVSKDITHIKKAKSVLQNFLLEVQKDPSIGDQKEVEEILAKVDEKVTAAEEEEARKKAEQDRIDAENANKPEGPDPDNTTDPMGPVGPDPGKKPRLIGAIVMGAGGAFTIGGGVTMALMALKGSEFEQELAKNRDQQSEAGCPNDTNECDTLEADEQTLVNNGRQANTVLLAAGLPLTVIGLGGIAAGAVVFIRGNKKTEAWQSGRAVRVTPTLNGLTIHGRF